MEFNRNECLAMQWHDRDDAEGIEAIRRAIVQNALPHLGIGDLAGALPPGAETDPEAGCRPYEPKPSSPARYSLKYGRSKPMTPRRRSPS